MKNRTGSLLLLILGISALSLGISQSIRISEHIRTQLEISKHGIQTEGSFVEYSTTGFRKNRIRNTKYKFYVEGYDFFRSTKAQRILSQEQLEIIKESNSIDQKLESIGIGSSSERSWVRGIDRYIKDLKKGDKIDVVYLESDPDLNIIGIKGDLKISDVLSGLGMSLIQTAAFIVLGLTLLINSARIFQKNKDYNQAGVGITSSSASSNPTL